MKVIKNASILRTLCALLAVLMMVSLAACDDKPSSKPSGSIVEESSSLLSSSSSSASSSDSSSSSGSSSSDSSSGSSSSSSAVAKDTRTPTQILNDMVTKTAAHHQKNQDTVGWLYVPGTTIDDVVVQTSDNDYYMRRNNLTKESFYGCYFADYRWENGTRDAMSKNTVIYGHSMSDNPEGEKGVKFGQLNKFMIDKAFAEENQFIYFNTPGATDMVWQIFAVFDTVGSTFNYIKPNPTDAELLNIINKSRSLSKYNYDTKVSTADKIITLSTCTYRHDANYPNDYRFVVMAKLVAKGTAPTPVKVELNPSFPKKPT